jgi:4a-hydroxytetrahydrobiopterin dehydratase
MTDELTPRQFLDMPGLEDWRLLGDGANAFFRTGSFAASAELVQAIAEVAGLEDNRPDVDIRGGGVTVRFFTLRPGFAGLTTSDADLAKRISEVAHARGLAADTTNLQYLLTIVGAPDIAAVMPFWAAILGYKPRVDSPEEDLVDPNGRNPGFWFEQMDAPRADGGGALHIGVWIPIEQAEARVAAALAAGGRMVRDDFAPSWWTLADAYGNEADVATVGGRGE